MGLPVYPLSQGLPKALVHLPIQKSGQGASRKLSQQIPQVGKHCQFPGVSQGLLLAQGGGISFPADAEIMGIS